MWRNTAIRTTWSYNGTIGVKLHDRARGLPSILQYGGFSDFPTSSSEISRSRVNSIHIPSSVHNFCRGLPFSLAATVLLFWLDRLSRRDYSILEKSKVFIDSGSDSIAPMGRFYDCRAPFVFKSSLRAWQSRTLGGRRLFLPPMGRSAIPVMQSRAIRREFITPSSIPPLSALRSEDEDIFGATILIFPSNHCCCEVLHRRIWEILISPRVQCILWTDPIGITRVPLFQENLQRENWNR